MKINPSHRGDVDPTRLSGTGAPSSVGGKLAARKPGAPKSDAVELSEQALRFHRANSAVQGAPDVREEKVALVRQRIESGTYEVDPALIARKMLEGS